MGSSSYGHIELLPSGSYRVHVYVGTDPLTGRRLRYRKTVRTEQEAQIALGRLLEQAADGKRPDSRVTVGELPVQYLAVAELDVSTRHTYEGYIRRTIGPALGGVELRKVRGPMLDTFYARLRRCGDVRCAGRSFAEHVLFPPLTVRPGLRPAWRQVADQIRAAIRSGELAPGGDLPSVPAVARVNGLEPGTVRHAMLTLDKEGLIRMRHGRGALVLGEPAVDAPRGGVRRMPAGHDCVRSGCRRHVCRPMSAATIRQIHAILSGAFSTAIRWEWIERNPAASARLPRSRYRAPSSPDPDAVAKVIAVARERGLEMLALYLWLAATTGARRGELCALQWADLDLDKGVVHIAYSYLVRPGVRARKDTKTHQDRYLALDDVTIAVLIQRRRAAAEAWAGVGSQLPEDAYIFSHDPAAASPWNPDWVTRKVAEVADAVGVKLNVKALRHYSASRLLAGGIDLRNTAARLGHGGGGATTLRHYADPVTEIDRQAATYLAKITAIAPFEDPVS